MLRERVNARRSAEKRPRRERSECWVKRQTLAAGAAEQQRRDQNGDIPSDEMQQRKPCIAPHGGKDPEYRHDPKRRGMKGDGKREHSRAPAPLPAHGAGGCERYEDPPKTVACGGADALKDPGGKEQHNEKGEETRLRAHRNALDAPLRRPCHRNLGKNAEIFK